MEILTQSKEHQKIQKISFELFKINQEFKQREQEFKKRKDELQKQIFDFAKKNDFNGFGFSIGNHTYSFCPVHPKSLVFDIQKLKKCLDKKTQDAIIKKEYTVSNMDGLIEYLKSCGVDPKKFKNYLTIKETVDTKAIDQLSALGQLDKEAIKDCYEVHKKTSYVKMQDWENKDDGEEK